MVNVFARVLQRQAKNYAARLFIVHRAALARKIWKHHKAAASRRNGPHPLHHFGVGLGHAAVHQIEIQCVAHPARQRAGGVGAARDAVGARHREVAAVDAVVVHHMVGTIVKEQRRPELEHHTPGLYNAHADGLTGGIPCATNNGRALGQARLCCRLCRHMAGNLVHKHGACQLVTPAKQLRFGLVDLPVLRIKRLEGRFCQKLVYHIFAGELCRNVGGTCEELARFGIDVRLVVFNPHNLGRNVVRTQRVAKQLFHALGAVMTV